MRVTHAGLSGLALVVSLFAASAQAAVVISTDQTFNMTCTKKQVCYPYGENPVLNVGQLEQMLASGNVSIITGQRNGFQADDIQIESAVAWASSNGLTLKARRVIEIDQPMSVQGTAASLTLEYGKHGALSFAPTGSVAFTDLASQLVIDKTPLRLVDDIDTWAADVAQDYVNCGGDFHHCTLPSYALARSIDASQQHEGAYGSSPVPSFDATFEGLGNTISNLTINDANDSRVALIGGVGANQPGFIRDLALTNVSIASAGTGAHVGALAADGCAAAFTGDSSTGSVTGGNSAWVGGLVSHDIWTSGCPRSSGLIDRSWSSATVTTGRASGGGEPWAGGLVAQADVIMNSHATGTVQAIDQDSVGTVGGGLAADAGTISGSYATGNVSAIDVNYPGSVGGLAGSVETLTSASFATGNVTGNYDSVGGLLGSATQVVNSYARGSATGGVESMVGGLIGLGDSTASSPDESSYSTGSVSAPQPFGIGGFNGYVSQASAPFKHCYWDIKTSGQSQGAGGPGGATSGIIGLTTKRLKSLPGGLSTDIWAVDPEGVVNNGFPYLINNPPPQ
jgi:hypothetical protein